VHDFVDKITPPWMLASQTLGHHHGRGKVVLVLLDFPVPVPVVMKLVALMAEKNTIQWVCLASE
jgi:hypothetical protein